MGEENHDLNIEKEITEDFTELLKGINEDTETLEETLKDISTMINSNEDNNDFSNVVRKRDYKGHVDIPKDEKKHKRRLKKWVYVFLLVLVIGIGFISYKVINSRNLAKKKEEETKIIENIKSHYNKYVKVDSDTELFTKESNEYKKIGKIYKDVVVELMDTNIDVNTEYFEIKDIGYYIKALEVTKADEIVNNDRYKKYLPFNINIVTKDNFTMYLDGNKLLTLDKEMEFPVIINNYDDKYYVEYNNKLVSISKDDVSKTVENKNTDKKNQSKITTLAYHRVYDTDDKCNDAYVCIKKANFDKQMKYLSDNNYVTLTLNELHMYLKGNLQIEKGVVITMDDGYQFKSADEVLDKYHLNATMFVITGEFDDFSRFENLKAIDLQSHTHNLHRNYVCSGGNQGGAILCASKEKIVSDLKKSLELLKVEPIGLAFPFYDYNDNAISALKEVGFKMSFVGRAGTMGKATPKVTNLYKIPRMTVWEESLMSFNSWKSYL